MIKNLIRSLFVCVVVLAAAANAEDVPAIASDFGGGGGNSLSSGIGAAITSGGGAIAGGGMSQQSGYANGGMSLGAGNGANGQSQINQGQLGAIIGSGINNQNNQNNQNDQKSINNRKTQGVGINDYGLSSANQRYGLPGSGFDEFTTNVFLRSGLKLPRYGYDFFMAPSGFIAADNVPASSNYVLGPGDQILIRGWGAIDINFQDVIDKEGGIVIPKVGRISLTGVKVGDLDGYLKNKIGKSYRNFSVSSTVTHLRSIQIVVAGFAASPGTYTVSALSTLTDAVFASGGPAAQGSLRHIQLKRGGAIIADYDMYDLFLNGNNSDDIRLAPGDLIYIQPCGSEVAIYDGVKVPGIYEAKKGETVADVVRFAGGYTFNNDKKKLVVEKMDAKNRIAVSDYDFATGLSQVVANGEIIHFFTAANQYDNAVALIGNVVHPTRLAWHKGMTVKDVIPNKNALLTKTFWNSYNYNTYALDNQANYLGKEKTNNWANVAAGNVAYSGGLNTVAETTADAGAPTSPFNVGDNLFVAGPIAIPEADINWHYAIIVRMDKANFQTQLIPFDLALALQGDPSNNLVLQAGDVINILSSKDVVSPARKGRLYILIDGEVNRPGVFELKPGSTLLDAISTAHGITSDAYLYGLILSRETVKKQQKASLNQMLDSMQQALLGQAATTSAQMSAGGAGATTGMVVSQQQALIDQLRQLKPTGRIVLGLNPGEITLNDLPNVKLENGDAIHIPPTPSTISVVGQVYNQATFIYSPHKSVEDYINMAGTTNDFADTSSIYVLHADGTLYSQQQAGWYGVFSQRKIYPGDAIVVPQNIQFMTVQQNLLNWTQILSNFGMGAASIEVFKQ